MAAVHLHVDCSNEIIPNRVQGYMLYTGQLINSVPQDLSLKDAGCGTRWTVADIVCFAIRISEGTMLESDHCQGAV
ncbi:MAG: hypothetical protein Kow0074_04550 [Candidatus Zixiibacteriota bacterium]